MENNGEIIYIILLVLGKRIFEIDLRQSIVNDDGLECVGNIGQSNKFIFKESVI